MYKRQAQLHPALEIQRLRQLIRQARKERDAGKPAKAFREVYRVCYAEELPPLTLEARSEEDEEN